MKIVSVINYKGGVGKTTVTANLAGELARRGKRVLMVDVDPQASLTFSFVRPRVWSHEIREGKTIKAWYDAILAGSRLALADIILTPAEAKAKIAGNGCLDLVPSHLELLDVELTLATHLISVNENQLRQNFLRVHSHLRKALAELPARKYDLVLIDCPPSFSLVTRNAVAASDYLLCPTRPDHVSTLGLKHLRDRVVWLRDHYNNLATTEMTFSLINPRFLGIIFTMVEFYKEKPIAAQAESIADVERDLAENAAGGTIFEPPIRLNSSRFAEAPEKHIPLVLQADSTALGQSIVKELRTLAENVARRIFL